jgi:hypothetical protein
MLAEFRTQSWMRVSREIQLPSQTRLACSVGTYGEFKKGRNEIG